MLGLELRIFNGARQLLDQLSLNHCPDLISKSVSEFKAGLESATTLIESLRAMSCLVISS